jgi:hypothetical protein
MSRVEEIAAAIETLPPEEFRQIADWCRERENTLWDDQIDADSASGRLDFLFEEAEREAAEGLLKEWPPNK